MKALVVYVCYDFNNDKKIDVYNTISTFKGEMPTRKEIVEFQDGVRSFPYKCDPVIINIIKLED